MSNRDLLAALDLIKAQMAKLEKAVVTPYDFTDGDWRNDDAERLDAIEEADDVVASSGVYQSAVEFLR